MKVVIVSTNDIKGGAARAAYRLHQSLISAGFESSMLVQSKWSKDTTVIEVDGSWKHWASRLRRFCEKLLGVVFRRDNKVFFSLGLLNNRQAVKAINSLEADIVHLHWFNSGLLSISDLSRINGRVVWSLHDMWAFTCGNHIDPRFDIRYGIEQSESLNLIEKIILSWKRKYYKRINTWTIVGVSSWISRSASVSALLEDFSHINLPNPIDTDVFRCSGRREGRARLGVEENDNVILFGAMNAETDLNKGFQLLVDALSDLPAQYKVVFFGTTSDYIELPLRQSVHSIGEVNSDEDLISLYSAADVMVVPSRCENLSNTIMEAMACSLPVVAFDVGGNNDMVLHQVNGYLATPWDSGDLARGIRWAVDENNNATARKAARDHVVQNFDARIVLKKYVQLYASL